MSGPQCGWIYEHTIAGAHAEMLLVLTENDWNEVMRDSVIVPIYRRRDVSPNLLRVRVGSDLYAECTRVQSLAQARFGRPLRPCEAEAWTRVRLGVRRFLDIDRRLLRAPKPPANPGGDDWHPRQDAVHFASLPGLRDDKLFAPVSDDDWNSTPGVRHCAAVRLTSRGPKASRRRWEVDVAGGWVVAGDVYALPYALMDPRPPRAPYPKALTPDESARIAERQRTALTLA